MLPLIRGEVRQKGGRERREGRGNGREREERYMAWKIMSSVTLKVFSTQNYKGIIGTNIWDNWQ